MFCFRFRSGQFWGCIGPHWKQINVEDEDLLYHAETCQVYSHNVKEKNLKFLPKGEHFGIFGGSLKL